MSYSVRTTEVFERQAKKLAKKYISLKTDLINLIKLIKETPKIGTPLGNDCYKIRFAISSKGKGKSGGARLITNVAVKDEIIYLVSIYDKSEKENITNKELAELLKYIP